MRLPTFYEQNLIPNWGIIILLPIKNIPLLLHDCFDKVRES